MVALAPCQSRPRSIRKETCGRAASSNIPMAAPTPHRHRIRGLFIWLNWATGQYHYGPVCGSVFMVLGYSETHTLPCVKMLRGAPGLPGGGSRWLLEIGDNELSQDATAMCGGVHTISTA